MFSPTVTETIATVSRHGPITTLSAGSPWPEAKPTRVARRNHELAATPHGAGWRDDAPRRDEAGGEKSSMDSTTFDALTRTIGSLSRRTALRGLVAGAATLVGGAAALDTEAKRRKKGKNKKGKPQTPPPPPQNQCTDGIKNGAESDVDCGGGTCPRCQGGQICNTRSDCHTALCTGGTCQSCAAPDDCGKDSDGDMCFCRDNAARPGERMCTRKTCKLFVGGTCADCAAGEQCAPAGPGAIECCAPCGS